METPKALGMSEAFNLFNTLSHEQQLAVMMARTRLARCQACPQEWPLAHKVGVADLCSGGIDQPTARDRQDCETPAGMERARVAARAMIAEMERPARHCLNCDKTATPFCIEHHATSNRLVGKFSDG